MIILYRLNLIKPLEDDEYFQENSKFNNNSQHENQGHVLFEDDSKNSEISRMILFFNTANSKIYQEVKIL